MPDWRESRPKMNMRAELNMNKATTKGSAIPDTGGGNRRFATAIRRRMKERMIDIYPDLTPGSVDVKVISDKQLFAHSNHFKCSVRGLGQDNLWVQRTLYAKRSQLAEIEYANLMSLWEGYFHGDSINRIPRPVDCWPRWNLLLSEYIPGQSPMLPWLFRYVSPVGTIMRSQPAKTRMQRTAEWLATFQLETIDLRAEAFPVDDIDEALGDLSSNGYVPHSTRRRLVEWLTSASSTLRSKSPILSHGDFAARNILQDHHSVAVVDWEKPLVKRHALYDVQLFLINLERRLSYPFSSHHRVEELKMAFLTRYLACVPFNIDKQQLEISRVIALIHELKVQYPAFEKRPMESALKRRGWFMRYLLSEIEKGIGIDKP